MGICQGIHQRFSFFKEFYPWGWRWLVLIIWGTPYAVGAFYDFLIGQDFVSSTLPKLSKLLTDWYPQWFFIWLLIGLILFAIVTFEGAYRMYRKELEMNIKVEPIRGMRTSGERTTYTAWAELKITNLNHRKTLQDVNVQINECVTVFENKIARVLIILVTRTYGIHHLFIGQREMPNPMN